MIHFQFEDVQYVAPDEFYDTCFAKLPDGRVVMAQGFLESMPPQPMGIIVSDGKHTKFDLPVTDAELA